MAVTDAAVAKMKRVRDFVAETPMTYMSNEGDQIVITVMLDADDQEFLDGLRRLLEPA